MALLLGASWPLIADNPIAPDAGLYPVVVDPLSPYADAIAADARFRVVAGDVSDLRDGTIALALLPDRIVYDAEAPRSLAALEALGQATRRWLEGELGREADQAAAFPILVNLVEENPVLDDATVPPPTDTTTPTDSPDPTPTTSNSPVLVGNVSDARLGLTPSEVDPPFPVRSLLLTFAFLIPMNLVGQLYSGSLLADRTRDRGLILLSTPLSGPAILLGRTLPYALIALVVVLVAAWATGAGPVGIAAALPMVFVVVAIAMVLGLLARNERELTFLLTGATTMLSTFLFLPAVFTQMPAIAFVSPVAVVAAAIEGDAITWGQFTYATAPLTLVTLALAAIGLSLYREETLFSSKGIAAKALEGLARITQRPWQVVAAGSLAVPFALALELFVLALVIPLGLRTAFPAFILGVAFVEEWLKRIAVQGHVLRGTLPGWKAGALSGAGFFLGEKIALVIALVGFGLLPFGNESLALWGVGGPLLLVAPLLLHTLTTAIAGATVLHTGFRRIGTYLAAVALHAGYNLLVVSLA